MLTGILLTAGLMMAPILLVGLLIALTLSLWCWKRIGPHVINFGRWMSDWRNLIPGGCLLFLGYMVAWVLMRLPSPLQMLGMLLLGILVAVTVVGGAFAFVALSARAAGWFWVIYKRQFWLWADDFVDVMWKRTPAAVPTRASRRPPSGASGTAAEASLPGPGPGVRRVPRKRSSAAAFWDLLLGNPQPKRRRPPPSTVQTTDQALGPSLRRAGRGPSLPGAAPAGAEEAAPAAAPAAAAAAAASPRPAQPEKAREPKPRAGAGNAVGRAVTFVPRTVSSGTRWVVRKSGDMLEWIRVRLDIE